MKKYFLLIFLSFSLMNAEDQSVPKESATDKKQDSLEQKPEKKMETTQETIKNSFEKLPENSFVKEICMKKDKNESCEYHCRKLETFLYCAEHWNKDLNEVDNKTLFEEAACMYCSNHDNDWQYAIGNSKYWHLGYNVNALGEKLKKSSEEILNELELILRHCIEGNEPVRKRVLEWQKENPRPLSWLFCRR